MRGDMVYTVRKDSDPSLMMIIMFYEHDYRSEGCPKGHPERSVEMREPWLSLISTSKYKPPCSMIGSHFATNLNRMRPSKIRVCDLVVTNWMGFDKNALFLKVNSRGFV